MVFLLATYRGDFPEHVKVDEINHYLTVKRFWLEFSTQTQDLSSVKYAIFGLGNSSTGDHFCAAAKALDAKCKEYQAVPILPLVCSCEMSADGYKCGRFS